MFAHPEEFDCCRMVGDFSGGMDNMVAWVAVVDLLQADCLHPIQKFFIFYVWWVGMCGDFYKTYARKLESRGKIAWYGGFLPVVGDAEKDDKKRR